MRRFRQACCKFRDEGRDGKRANEKEEGGSGAHATQKLRRGGGEEEWETWGAGGRLGLRLSGIGREGGGGLEGKELTSGPCLSARERGRERGELAGWAGLGQEGRKEARGNLGLAGREKERGEEKEFHFSFFSKTIFQTHFFK